MNREARESIGEKKSVAGVSRECRGSVAGASRERHGRRREWVECLKKSSQAIMVVNPHPSTIAEHSALFIATKHSHVQILMKHCLSSVNCKGQHTNNDLKQPLCRQESHIAVIHHCAQSLSLCLKNPPTLAAMHISPIQCCHHCVPSCCITNVSPHVATTAVPSTSELEAVSLLQVLRSEESIP